MYCKPVLLLVMIALFGGCATYQKGPLWQGKSWSEGDNLYFSGISSEKNTIQEAKQEAYNNALTGIADYLGVTLNIDSQNTISSQANDYKSYMQAETKDVLVKQVYTTEFMYQSFGNKYVGNILLEYNQKTMQQELARREEALQQHQQEERLKKQQEQAIKDKRKNLGPIEVKINPADLDIKNPLIKKLGELGYSLATEGKTLLVKITNTSYSQAKNLSTCQLSVEVNFEGQILGYQVKGFGKDQASALKNAVKELVREFPADIR